MGAVENLLIGPERTSLGSDLGQVNNPPPIGAYKQIVGNLLDSGFKEEDIQLMIRDNPARRPLPRLIATYDDEKESPAIRQ